MSKKVSYKNLLKQAISEYDTSKTVQVKGPMLDPILSWDGDGELPVYKDAASILERYYFNERAEEPVMVQNFDEDEPLQEAEYSEVKDKVKVGKREYNQDGTEAKTPSEEHGEGPGTQQAGTSDARNIRGHQKNQAEDIAKEDVEVDFDEDDTLFAEDTLADDIELFFSEQDEAEEAAAEKDEEDEEEDEDKGLDVDKKMAEKEGEESAEMEEAQRFTEDAENAVIEKLIDEMEELDEAPMTYSKEGPRETGKKQMTYDKEGPAPGMEAPDEKASTDPEQHTFGAGTDQAGTGKGESQIPPRKDQHDQTVKPKKYTDEPKDNRVSIPVRDDVDLFDQDLDMEIIESLGLEEELDEEMEGIEEKEWSGKEVPPKHKYKNEPEETKMESSAVPGGPSPKKSGPEGEDWDEGRYYEESAMRESFELFKEAIKEDEEAEDDDDNIIV